MSFTQKKVQTFHNLKWAEGTFFSLGSYKIQRFDELPALQKFNLYFLLLWGGNYSGHFVNLLWRSWSMSRLIWWKSVDPIQIVAFNPRGISNWKPFRFRWGWEKNFCRKLGEVKKNIDVFRDVIKRSSCL